MNVAQPIYGHRGRVVSLNDRRLKVNRERKPETAQEPAAVNPDAEANLTATKAATKEHAKNARAKRMSSRPQSEIDRAADIERAVAELRAKYIRDFVHEETPHKWRVLHYAAASDMTDAAFRNLFIDLSFADENGENSYQSNETTAKLTGRSLSTVKRGNAELKEGKWRITTKRRRNDTAIVKVALPQKAIDAILFEILEPSLVKVQDFGSVAREPSKTLEGSPVSLPEALEGSPVSLPEALEGSPVILQDFGSVARDPLTIVIEEEEVKHTGSATSNGLDWKGQAQVECSTSVALNGHASACLAEETQLQRRGTELFSVQGQPSKEPPLPPRVYNPSQIAHNTQGGEAEDYNLSNGDDLFEHIDVWKGLKGRACKIEWRWGYAPDVKPRYEKDTRWSQAGRFVKLAKRLSADYPAKFFEDQLESTLCKMEGMIEREPEERSQPGTALAYFEETLRGKLRKAKGNEDAEQIDAQKRRARAAIELNGANAREEIKNNIEMEAGGKKLGALDRGIASTEQKRLASAGANGKGKDNRTADERVLDAICREDERKAAAQPDRFPDDKRTFNVIGTTIDRTSFNPVLKDVPGATTEHVCDAVLAVGSSMRDEGLKYPDPLDVITRVRKQVIFAVHGYPWDRCGGPVGKFAEYTSAHGKWVSFNQEFVDRMMAAFPLLHDFEWGHLMQEVQPAYKMTGPYYLELQAEAEEEFEKLAAEKHKEAKQTAEREAKWKAQREEAFRERMQSEGAGQRVVNRGI